MAKEHVPPVVTCPVSMAWPRMRSALARDASPATAASEPEMRRGPSILDEITVMEETMATGNPREGSPAIYLSSKQSYFKTAKTKTSSLASTPVPHRKLTPSELLLRPTVARHEADAVADSSVGVVQVVPAARRQGGCPIRGLITV